MAKVEFLVDKEMNFLMVLYQKIKNQNNFENLNFEKAEKLNKKDKDEIKKIIRQGCPEISKKSIKDNPKLKEIYEINQDKWDKYWEENLESLLHIKSHLFIQWLQYEIEYLKKDIDILSKVSYFFECDGPETIYLYFCMGSETNLGTGNAFTPNIAVVFPRNFKEKDPINIKNDFGVLLHELLHLNQNMCNGEDKEIVEIVAKCFAPKGILYKEEKNKEDKEIFEIVKNAFNKGKTYRGIKDKIIQKNNLIKLNGGQNGEI